MSARANIVKRARTDWKLLLVIAVMATTAAAAIYFAPSNDTRVLRKEVRAGGTPCVALRDGSPSPGCYRQLRLYVRACGVKPRLCGRAAVRALRSERKLVDMAVLRSLGRLEATTRRQGGAVAPGTATPAPAPGSGGGGGPRGGVPAPQPPAPGGGGGGGGGGPPGGGGGAGPLGDARDTVNDLTEQLGLGRPVPPLPPLLNPPRR